MAKDFKDIPRANYGPPPMEPRSGDKKQARQRINVLVRTGKIAHPNTIPCVDCGHVYADGERRHEYDHHLGYAAEHHYSVQSVCTTCHAKRDNSKANQTHCRKGHEFTVENTIIRKNGTRHCRECERNRDRNRRDATFWRNYRENKKSRNIKTETLP